jgi:prevent-host-death family protein
MTRVVILPRTLVIIGESMPTPRKAKRPAHNRRVSAPPRQTPSATVAAATFKAQCLALMDRVDRTGEEIVITKLNRPVAKLVSTRTAAQPRRFAGRSQGQMRFVGDPLAPINADWNVGEDL